MRPLHVYRLIRLEIIPPLVILSWPIISASGNSVNIKFRCKCYIDDKLSILCHGKLLKEKKKRILKGSKIVPASMRQKENKRDSGLWNVWFCILQELGPLFLALKNHLTIEQIFLHFFFFFNVFCLHTVWSRLRTNVYCCVVLYATVCVALD